MARLKIVYFAWVREKIGRDEDMIDPPDRDETIGRLLDRLSLDEQYAGAFEERDKLRFALDQNFATAEQPIGTAKELAIFPPVTGG